MVFLMGMLSLAAPVIALISGGLVAAAISARDLSVFLAIRIRMGMVAVGAGGYILSGGIGFVVDAQLRTPLISYAFIFAVVTSSLLVGAAIIRWMAATKTKLTVFDQTRLQNKRISA